MLAQTWRRTMAPQLTPSCCILAARMATNALTALGVRSIEIPVAVAAYNQRGWEERNLPIKDWSPDAWSVGASSRQVAYQFRQDGGFDGHVVVGTENFVIDLSAPQFDRPMRSIVTGGPLVARWEAFEVVSRSSRKIGLLEGVYLIEAEPWNTGYKESLDWKRGWRKFGGEFVENLKDSLRGQVGRDQEGYAFVEGGVPAIDP